MTKFEVGKSYSDGGARFTFTCVGRTAKMATFSHRAFGETRVKLHQSEWSGEQNEVAYPLGTYSMCPVIRAGRESN